MKARKGRHTPVPRPADSPYRNEDEAASYLRLRATTLRDMRIKGTGPRYRKHGDRVVYSVADLDQWSDARSRVSTTDAVTEDRAGSPAP